MASSSPRESQIRLCEIMVIDFTCWNIIWGDEGDRLVKSEYEGKETWLSYYEWMATSEPPF